MSTEAGNEAARIVESLKRIMKSRSVTYSRLARGIDLSEASVKRIFSRGTLTLDRLQQICFSLGITIQEVVRLASELDSDTPDVLTLEQEDVLAADFNLLACFYLLANGRTGREVAEELRSDERQVRKWFVRLHSLGLIQLQDGMRAKARVTSAIVWCKDGPVRRAYEERARMEFMQSPFSGASELQHFRSAELSEASWRVFLRKLERLTAEFRDLAEIDRSLPSREKRSVAIMLAARPWVFSMFNAAASRR